MTHERDRLRLRAQLLSGPPAAGPVEVVERLLAVQAQDSRGFRLAVRARTRGLGVADVDRCLTEDRSLIVTWCLRGTLHLVRAEDYSWLHALTAPTVGPGNARRLGQEGVSPAAAERGVAVVCRALADEGPLTRGALRERLDGAGVPTRGQALPHLLLLTSLRGHIVRGPVVGRDHAYVLVDDWLGPQPAVDRDAALAELARRYLAGHGPADDRDLARWSGLPLRDARFGLRAAARGLVDRAGGLVDLPRTGRPAVPAPRLLGPFDPLLLGWTSREGVLDVDGGVVTSNGIFRAVALVDGRAVATWTLSGGKLVITPFAAVPARAAAAIEAEVADVLRFLGS